MNLLKLFIKTVIILIF